MTTFVFKFLIYGIQFAVGLIVILAVVVALTYLLSRSAQLFASLMGYEIGSFFDWLFGGIARRLGWKKKKRKESP